MAPGEPEVDPTSVGALVHQLVADAREFATAEIAVAKAKALEQVGRYKTAGIFFGVAGTLALAGLIALLVGLILTLTPLVGPGWATLIVIGATLAIAGVLAMIGKARLAPPKEIAPVSDATDVLAAEARAAAARQKLTSTVGALQDRLAPEALARDAAETLTDAGRKALDSGVDKARAHPALAAGGAALVLTFLARRPLMSLFRRRKRAT